MTGLQTTGPEAADVFPAPKLMDLLVCPMTKSPLVLDSENGCVRVPASGIAYPLCGGVPQALPELAYKLDTLQKV